MVLNDSRPRPIMASVFDLEAQDDYLDVIDTFVGNGNCIATETEVPKKARIAETKSVRIKPRGKSKACEW